MKPSLLYTPAALTGLNVTQLADNVTQLADNVTQLAKCSSIRPTSLPAVVKALLT